MLEEFQIYRKAEAGFLMPGTPREWLDVKIGEISGDRSGLVHLGHNQSLYLDSGRLPVHLSTYHGSDTTLQGELRAAGVTISMEGIIKNVENLTIVDGGKNS